MPAYVPTESYPLDTGGSAYGTILQVSNDASPEVFHTIAGVGDIDGPNMSLGVNERLTHSTGRPFKNKSAGLIDPGDLSFPVFFDPSNPSHSFSSTGTPFGLGFLFNNRVTRKWRVIYPDAANTTYQFKGFISALGTSAPTEGDLTRKATLTIDGLISEIPFPYGS